ncbi:Transcription termination factor 2 [Strongyloides ratti]|uniref:Transcription termination factor 2 n=1 Tax=Strongyloides ratti TaxID=34506 RepID=A0A090LGL8_STRRB|nr:Transcription termination factor 2 [Strongyloides ratti]CEF67253.1 Transcription termination factor 2 [Strongyloides ratti]
MKFGDYSFVTSTPVNKNLKASSRFLDNNSAMPSPIIPKHHPPNIPVKSNVLDYKTKDIDETIFISDDEDPVFELPCIEKKSTMDPDVVNSLGERFRKSLSGMGDERTALNNEVNSNANKVTDSKFGGTAKNGSTVGQNVRNSYKNITNNEITKGVSSNTGINLYNNKLNQRDVKNFDTISEIAKTLKRRSPPPTFNTPDRPKVKPMAAFRKMQKPGPVLCSPQPLTERVVKEQLKDKKELRDVVLNPIISQEIKYNRAVQNAIDEIKSTGKEITLDGDTIETIIAVNKTKRLIGGLMNENRMITITSKLADLFKTLLTFIERFDTKMKVETPDCFIMELNPYQKKGLAFLIEREKSYPCGGILADDMGLGKTAQMISLLVYQKNNALANKQIEHIRRVKAKENAFIPIKTTLIITPLSLMDQWESEIRKFTSSGFLTVYQFHGPKRTNDPHILGQYDVVISSYNTIASEFTSVFNSEDEENGHKFKKGHVPKKSVGNKIPKVSVLDRVCFQRVILDEAHTIKNRNSRVSRACSALSSLYRWCVTGTPVHNEMMDAFSLFRFLHCHPIDQEAMWRQYMSSGSQEGPFRLETLVKATLLRRTKNDTSEESGEKLVNLPKRHVKQVNLEMMPNERLIYDQMFKAAQKFVKNFLDEFSDKRNDNELPDSKNPFLNAKMSERDGQFQKMACILVYLLRLRQACNHLYLTKAGLDLNCFDAIDEKSAKLMKDDISMAESFNESVMSNAQSDDHLEVFNRNFLSSKVKALFKHLSKILNETKDKVIIISQWTSMFFIIQSHLNKKGIPYVEITGEVSQEDRQKAQSAINSKSDNVRIMFLSLKAGGVGLNLIGANHIFMLDLHWNPFNEDQACDRIYRIGQTKEVFIHKFVCKNTVENRVLELQNRKRELSKEFLGETRVKKANHLNNEDLAFIFDC